MATSFNFPAVLDSWARPEGNLYSGNRQWYGSYDECISSTEGYETDFIPKYCTTHINTVSGQLIFNILDVLESIYCLKQCSLSMIVGGLSRNSFSKKKNAKLKKCHILGPRTQFDARKLKKNCRHPLKRSKIFINFLRVLGHFKTFF